MASIDAGFCRVVSAGESAVQRCAARKFDASQRDYTRCAVKFLCLCKIGCERNYIIRSRFGEVPTARLRRRRRPPPRLAAGQSPGALDLRRLSRASGRARRQLLAPIVGPCPDALSAAGQTLHAGACCAVRRRAVHPAPDRAALGRGRRARMVGECGVNHNTPAAAERRGARYCALVSAAPYQA